MKWKVTLIFNTLTMGVFALASEVSQVRLRNVYVQYPESAGGVTLPAISALALKIYWMPAVIALGWALITLVLLLRYWKRPVSPVDTVQLHTSATILLGTFMLMFFIFAGLAPFLSIVLKLS